MTKEQFDQFIDIQHKKGLDDDDIVKVFCLMFRDGKLNREQLEAVCGLLGYTLSDDFQSMSDDELKDKILTEEDSLPEGSKQSQFYLQQSEADKNKSNPSAEQVKKSGDYESDFKENESDSESDVGSKPKEDGEDGESDEKEDEKERAMRLFGLGK